MNSLPLRGGRERYYNNTIMLNPSRSSQDIYKLVPCGDLLGHSVILFDKLQEFPEETEQPILRYITLYEDILLYHIHNVGGRKTWVT